MSYLVGLDPGKGGGIVKLQVCGAELKVVEGWPMPESEKTLTSLLLRLCKECEKIYVEKIPKFAGENRSAAIMSVLHENYAFCRGIILASYSLQKTALLVDVPILRWMNEVIPNLERSRERKERKAQLQVFAQRQFPEWKWTLQMSDAPLIALGAWRAGL